MATSAPHEVRTASVRRLEIEDWFASLATRTDAAMLELPERASSAEIRAAFAVMARRFHPDTLPAGEDDLRPRLQSIFARITEAYGNLIRRRPPLILPAPKPAAPVATPPPTRASAASDLDARRARVEAALSAALELIGRKQTDEAVTVLHEVLTQADEPRRRRVRLLLARAYAEDATRRRHAVAFLRELVAQNPHDAEALAALGELYWREGLLTRAEQMLARALAGDPGLAQARLNLRSVRAALASRTSPPRRARRRSLISRLLSVARQGAES